VLNFDAVPKPSGEPAGGLFLVMTALLRDLLLRTHPVSLLAVIPWLIAILFAKSHAPASVIENYVTYAFRFCTFYLWQRGRVSSIAPEGRNIAQAKLS
jgi:hypothetical protein